MTASFQPGDYGPVLSELLQTDRRRPLGPGEPDPRAGDKLRGIVAHAVFAPKEIRDVAMAQCCISALWLLYDHLDESHKLSQEIETPSGSFLHGIMHRREGDFSNAKYWFRRVGRHPVYERLAEEAAGISRRSPRPGAGVLTLVDGSGLWDPYAFVDACQSVLGSRNDAHEFCLDVQQAEWELLFDHCYRAATNA